MGISDNTLIILTSDNGASREGELLGTSAYYVHLLQGDDLEADLARLDELVPPEEPPQPPPR